jgi:hypothetical protein
MGAVNDPSPHAVKLQVSPEKRALLGLRDVTAGGGDSSSIHRGA